MTYLLHYCIGLLGIGAGYLGRNFCSHRHHQIIATACWLAFESFITVSLIG